MHEDDLKKIPNDKYFAVKGTEIKEIMKILQVIQIKDRNNLIRLPVDFDAKGLYSVMQTCQEVTIIPKNVIA